MKYDTAGTYKLTYTATDECGNETVEERTVIVEESSSTKIYVDVTNYTAPNSTPTPRAADEWAGNDDECEVEAEGVVITTYGGEQIASGVSEAYIEPDYMLIKVWGYGDTWVTLYLNSEGTAFTSQAWEESSTYDNPKSVFFEKLIVKREV